MSTQKTTGYFVGGLLLIALVVFGFGSANDSDVPAPTEPQNDTLGQIIERQQKWFSRGAQLGDQVVFWEKRTISAGDNNDGWENDTGKTVYVDLVEFTVNGTASSTYIFEVATSSTQNISDGASPYSEFIDSYNAATGTTNNIVPNSISNGGTNGKGVVPVGAGEFVSLRFLPEAGLGGCDGSACEEATSSNNGISSIIWKLRYHTDGR